MSVSEEKSSPPGGLAVEQQKICMPPPTNSQQISGASIASAMSQGGALLGLSEGPATEGDLLKAMNELAWSASSVMAIPDSRSNCSAGAHEWDHKTHRCIHCQTPVMSFLNASWPGAQSALGQQSVLGISPAQIAAQRSEVNTVPLNQGAHLLPSHWVYPTSRYQPQIQKISQQENPGATPGTEIALLRREVRHLQLEVDRLRDVRDALEHQNLAQAQLIAGMEGAQHADTDGLFKARVEAAAIAAVEDKPVNIEKAAQDTIDAMAARKLSRGMTEKLRDTAVESLRKGDRDASVGRAIGVKFGGGLRQPW